MKNIGSKTSFFKQRNDALLKTYRLKIHDASFVSLNNIINDVVNSPAPRFWVSEERALAVVSALLRGCPVLDSMLPSKREMFAEIHRRSLILKKQFPKRSLSDIVADVVNSPAPKFYIKPSSARIYLFKIRNGSYECNIK